jgi:hypothetical protein
MELKVKSIIFNKSIMIVFFVTFFTQCKNESKQINCEEFNIKSAQFLEQYYTNHKKKYLDSASFYIDKGVNNCTKYKNILSLRKLSILAEQQRFLEAIKFIQTFDKEMFSDLPYYQKLLINRFKVMEAIKENDSIRRDEYLLMCTTLINNYLLANKDKADLLLKESSIEKIMKDPLGTALTQYYYYKSVNNLVEVKRALRKMEEERDVNIEYINYLQDYLKTDFMEFDGI